MSTPTTNRATARAGLQTSTPTEKKPFSRTRLIYLGVGILSCLIGVGLIVSGLLN